MRVPAALLLAAAVAHRFELEVADDGGTWRVGGASWKPGVARGKRM